MRRHPRLSQSWWMESVVFRLFACLCLFFERTLTFLLLSLTGSPQVRPHRWRSEEAASVSSWNGCPSWDSQISKIHRSVDSQGTIPASCAWNRSGLQVGSSFSIHRCAGIARSQWSILGWIIWGHQSLRNPCKACHNHAQGYPVGTPHPWWTRLNHSFVVMRVNRRCLHVDEQSLLCVVLYSQTIKYFEYCISMFWTSGKLCPV